MNPTSQENILRFAPDDDEIITKILLPKLSGNETPVSRVIENLSNDQLGDFVRANPDGFITCPRAYFRENNRIVFLTRTTEESLTHLFPLGELDAVTENPTQVLDLKGKLLGYKQEFSLSDDHGLNTGYTLVEYFLGHDRNKVVAKVQFNPADREIMASEVLCLLSR